MPTELSRKIQDIMTREMGQLGKFIIKKQCRDLGIDPDNIKEEDVSKLARALGRVMVTFGGPEKGRAVENEIRRLIKK